MTTLIPAPAYVLARAAWVPTLVIWHADGGFTRLEGDPCEEYAAALAASWWLRSAARDGEWPLMNLANTNQLLNGMLNGAR